MKDLTELEFNEFQMWQQSLEVRTRQGIEQMIPSSLVRSGFAEQDRPFAGTGSRFVRGSHHESLEQSVRRPQIGRSLGDLPVWVGYVSL